MVRSNLKEAYKTNSNGEVILSDADIDSEIVAMFSENRIFTDKNTVDDIARLNLGVAEKIYNWVKEKVYSFIPGSREKAMMLKAERLYRNAIEETKRSTNSNGTKYKIDSKDYSLDIDYFKYDNLIKLPDLNVKAYKWKVIDENKSDSEIVSDIKSKALTDGAKEFNENGETEYSFIVDYGDKEILVNKKSLTHSKNVPFKKRKAVLNVFYNLVEILSSSIKLNEGNRKKEMLMFYLMKLFLMMVQQKKSMLLGL